MALPDLITVEGDAAEFAAERFIAQHLGGRDDRT